ncbi:MAG: tetratricopeptide repeat protein [Bacteroidota bacterium]
MKNNKTRTLILTMTVLVFTGIVIAWFYYGGINRSVDPRIKGARELYEKYNEFTRLGRYDSILWLMDTIESVYSSVDHYRDSYETAVLYNNRAAVYLSVYMQPGNEILIGDTAAFISKAENAVRKSIHIYREWSGKFDGLDEIAIRENIEENFLNGMDPYSPDEKEQFLDKRVREIIEAQKENRRRLSVSYTNLGIIKRHQQKYDSAAMYYMKAIDLWERNLTAENNLNILLSRPLKKQGLLQKLFPPEK